MQERFETFTVLINRISRNIRKIKNQEMAEYNLRSAHVSCLYYLFVSNGATATELCERCEEDKATILEAAQKISSEINVARQKIDLNDKLAKLKNIYKLYQAETTANVARISPRELVNFLLKHQNDNKLKGALTSDTIKQLGLAQYIMNNQSTKYSADSLAQDFNLDQEKVKLAYALYNYRYENKNLELSLKTLINFIDEKVLPNPNYANRLSENEQTQLHTIATLMRAAANGNTYNCEALYRAILPLASNLDKNQLFLAYLYHGSLYDYDENWTLTVEKFINFLQKCGSFPLRFQEKAAFAPHGWGDMTEKRCPAAKPAGHLDRGRVKQARPSYSSFCRGEGQRPHAGHRHRRTRADR
jgi:hypothetical protein